MLVPGRRQWVDPAAMQYALGLAAAPWSKQPSAAPAPRHGAHRRLDIFTSRCMTQRLCRYSSPCRSCRSEGGGGQTPRLGCTSAVGTLLQAGLDKRGRPGWPQWPGLNIRPPRCPPTYPHPPTCFSRHLTSLSWKG